MLRMAFAMGFAVRIIMSGALSGFDSSPGFFVDTHHAGGNDCGCLVASIERESGLHIKSLFRGASCGREQSVGAGDDGNLGAMEKLPTTSTSSSILVYQLGAGEAG